MSVALMFLSCVLFIASVLAAKDSPGPLVIPASEHL